MKLNHASRAKTRGAFPLRPPMKEWKTSHVLIAGFIFGLVFVLTKAVCQHWPGIKLAIAKLWQ
jgi:hypothetical protein